LLESSDLRTRLMGVEALGKLGHEAVPRLAKVAFNDRRVQVKLIALLTLRDIGRGLKGVEVEGEEAKALQLVGPFFSEHEHHSVVSGALRAALDKKLDEASARALVNKLRRELRKRTSLPP